MHLCQKVLRKPFAWILAIGVACGAGSGYAVTAMKNPLYGDPKHPNISGMWNPEFAYFGPPIGKAAGAPGGFKPGGFPRGGFPPRPPEPQLTPAYAAKYAEWRKKFAEGKQ